MDKSRAFTHSRNFSYLADEDRYLTQTAAPELRFGFIGCGMMGQEHMRNTLLEGRATVAGIYDPAPDSGAHALQMLNKHAPELQVETYSDIAAAASASDTDALIIASPNHTHLDVVRQVIGCGKALLLEKPIATSIDDAMEIYRLLNSHNGYVQIGLQYRYKWLYREAMREMHAGSLGRIHSVQVLEHRFPFLDKVGQWNKFNANTGGTLVEKCCHYFDLINLFADGVPTQVYAQGSQAVNFANFKRDGRSADGLDQANVLIQYDNGVLGNFSLNMFTHGSREELILCGDAARLHTVESSRLGGPNTNTLSLWAGDQGVSRETQPSYPPFIAQAGHHGSTFHEHVALADALLGMNTQEVTPPTLTDAVWSVVVASAAQASIERGEGVHVTEFQPDDLPLRDHHLNGA